MVRIDFRFHKYNDIHVKQTWEYQPRSFILFQNTRIGVIKGGEVYFFIKSPEDKCLNYVPKLWKVFSNHNEAREQVKKNQEEIWQTLDIYHPLKLNVK